MEELNEFEKRKRARRYLCQIQKYCDEIKLREEALRELNSTLAYKAKGVAAGGVQRQVRFLVHLHLLQNTPISPDSKTHIFLTLYPHLTEFTPISKFK